MHTGIRIFAAFATLLGLAFSAAGAGAQVSGDSPETTCVSADLGGQQLQVGLADRTSSVAVALPAGTVSIPSARATDGYPSRVNVTQLSEKYEVEFLSATGEVIATSAPTADVPDMVVFGEWIGSLGSVELSEPAVAVRAHHRPDLPTDGSPESVRANELTFCFDVTTPPTTTPAPVCGDDGVTTNPDGTPCNTATTNPTPICGDDGVTTNPDGTPCNTATTNPAPSPTVVTTTEGELPPEGPTTSTTITEGEEPPVETSTSTVAPESTTTEQPPAGPTDPLLPVTGSSSALLVTLGGIMLVAGGALTLANRRMS